MSLFKYIPFFLLLSCSFLKREIEADKLSAKLRPYLSDIVYDIKENEVVSKVRGVVASTIERRRKENHFYDLASTFDPIGSKGRIYLGMCNKKTQRTKISHPVLNLRVGKNKVEYINNPSYRVASVDLTWFESKVDCGAKYPISISDQLGRYIIQKVRNQKFVVHYITNANKKYGFRSFNREFEVLKELDLAQYNEIKNIVEQK